MFPVIVEGDRSTSHVMPLLRRPPAAPHRTPIHHDKRLHLFSTHNTRHRATVSSLPVTCLRIRYSSSNPVRHLCGIPSSRCHAAADPAPSKIPGGGSGALEAGVVGWRDLLLQVGEVLSLGFPVWVASACAVALWRPPAFLWVSPMAQIVGISFTMLGLYYSSPLLLSSFYFPSVLLYHHACTQKINFVCDGSNIEDGSVSFTTYA